MFESSILIALDSSIIEYLQFNVWENFFIMAFVLWPTVVLISAGFNMLISWTFSWSELIIDWMIGVLLGICFYVGTVGDVRWYDYLFLIISHGFFGFLRLIGDLANVAFLTNPMYLFLITAMSTVCATVLSAGLDRLTVSIEEHKNLWGAIISIFVFPLKLPFTLVTSTLGWILGLIGLAVGAAMGSPGFAWLGGCFFFKWGLSDSTYATTFGWAVNVWQGTIEDVTAHELYHTRQYIYLREWLGIFYFTIAGLWGLISSAIAAAVTSSSFDVRHFFTAMEDKEVGNPIECAAYKKWPP